VTTFFTALVALVIGLVFGRYRTHVIQNGGEAQVSRALTHRFLPPNYYLLNHLTLRFQNFTTQIDHVLISRFGVYVIETKHYKGWIFASPADRYWTQVLFRAKFKFQNPIRQNYRHLCAVQELLDFLPPDAVRPIVVFTGNVEFKTPIPEGVLSLAEFLTYVERHTTEIMSANRLQFCVGRLETARLAITKTTDIEHVQQLRKRYGNDGPD
jgi:hypothetical protein